MKITVQQPSRVDYFLKEYFTQYSRSQIQKNIDSGGVKLNGEIVLKNSKTCKEGDEIEWIEPIIKQALPFAEAENIPLNIIYEDEELLIINKEAGMVVHASAGHDRGTLVHALKFRYPDFFSENSIERPGIVHRLDKESSGLLIVAKNATTQMKLSKMFHDREIKKTYQAFAWGIFKNKNGMIESKIGRARSDRKKMSSRTAKGRLAQTHYEVMKESLSLQLSHLELKPITGRTHQIRVHCCEEGHPLLGDKVYGSKNWVQKLSSKQAQYLEKIDRHCLHASALEFNHPKTKKKMNFKIELSPELKELEKILFENK